MGSKINDPLGIFGDEISGANWGWLEGPPPKISKMIFVLKCYWFCWFNVQYIHSYQALVPFSEWIDFNIGGDETGFLAWRRKKKFLHHKKDSPPRNLWIDVLVEMHTHYSIAFWKRSKSVPTQHCVAENSITEWLDVNRKIWGVYDYEINISFE